MSFKELNQSSIINVHDRSCMIIVNANNKEKNTIKNIGRLVGIKDCIFLESKNGVSTIKNILNDEILENNEEVWKNKAVIFNNITQFKINGFLESLKKMKIARPLSAVVTETTIDWTLNKLVYNLIQEKNALKSGKTFNH